jgi:RNA polymerase II-associated protein 3
MPPKYSHVKKRPPLKAKKATPQNGKPIIVIGHTLDPFASPATRLQLAISRVLLVRYEQDIARLYSTHLFTTALSHLPALVLRCADVAGPGWIAAHAGGEEVKRFLRTIIAMELRESGERVATKSVLWTYTALRHFVRPVEIFMRQCTCSSSLLRTAGNVQRYLSLPRKGLTVLGPITTLRRSTSLSGRA